MRYFMILSACVMLSCACPKDKASPADAQIDAIDASASDTASHIPADAAQAPADAAKGMADVVDQVVDAPAGQ